MLPVTLPALLRTLGLAANVQAAVPVGPLVEELRASGAIQVRTRYAQVLHQAVHLCK